MNRTLALLLTLAVLLAHMLAIHKSTLDEFAPPFEGAHVTYRIARNLVESRHLAWDPSMPAVESFPSFLWVAVAALGQELGIVVTRFCQCFATISALITILILAQFSPVRLAGVIAPLLFVVSGGIAAAAASGAETATFALFVVTSFLAFERRAAWSFAAVLCLAVVTREEGVAFALMLLLLEIAGRLRHGRGARASLLPMFVPAALVFGAMTWMRHEMFGVWLSPFLHAWTSTDGARWLDGLRYLAGFVRGSGWTVLLFFPLYYLARGSLTGVGRRAMLLSLGYAALVAGQGGGHGPMFQPLVPMFALLMIAMQEAMTLALDSSRRAWPKVTWAMFLLALASSALASKYPGDLWLLPTDKVHRDLVQSTTPPRLSYNDLLGRLGLTEEIELTDHLRTLGIFLRDNLYPGDSVLTPWPGAIGYLSKLRVIDAYGRTTLLPGESVPRPWSGVQRADVLELIELGADYVVPSIGTSIPPTMLGTADSWVKALDSEPVSASRTKAIRTALEAYELITVPVPIHNWNDPRAPTRPMYLLRRRAMGRTPRLEVAIDGERFRVSAIHESHEQIVDLRVVLIDSKGQKWSVLPTGTVRKGANSMMRTSLLLFSTGERKIDLAAGEFPAGFDIVEMEAVLRNPQARGEHKFALSSESANESVGR
ncbi:MAG TPA: hypothetical protein VM509_04395 [Planctomycetota bacterium]|nr:hypothetical protein [Planctomycetota bacterium]